MPWYLPIEFSFNPIVRFSILVHKIAVQNFMYTMLWVYVRDFSKVVLILFNHDFTCREVRINLTNTDCPQAGLSVMELDFPEASCKLALGRYLR